MTYFCPHCKTPNPDPYPGATTCVQCAKDMLSSSSGREDVSTFGCVLSSLLVLAVLAAPVVSLVTVTSWWTVIAGPLRSLLELLPSSVVARTADGPGSPYLVGSVTAASVLAVAVWLSVLRRTAVRSWLAGGSRMPAVGLGVLRAAVLVAGAPLALVVALIAAGADLQPDAGADVLSAWWQIGAVVLVVLVWGFLGTTRLSARMATRT
ncbi:hypothetical protein ACI3EY_01095 [Ornithinimicrobium sp. LYQ92]|uniref:hypothetical protein n=1 Tax=Serinicoccus sp. LYQ92 TaxID=3378798 RepID=UPI00385470B7